MKRLLLSGLFMSLAACAQLDAEWTALTENLQRETHKVTVNGREWSVIRHDDDRPQAWKAVRATDLAPYGRPGQPRAPEAVRVIETATGCTVLRDTLVQDTSANFYADVTCP